MHNGHMTAPALTPAERRLQEIRSVVAALAPGEVVTYGTVASRAGLPGRARLVGTALRTVGAGSALPWHRVVGAGGRIVFAPGSREAEEQAKRLRHEGLEVVGRHVRLPRRVDLDALLWGAPRTDKMASGRQGRQR